MESEHLHPHFHVWEPITFACFLASLNLPFALELLQTGIGEFMVVMRRQIGLQSEDHKHVAVPSIGLLES
jgi:hypothetical protein